MERLNIEVMGCLRLSCAGMSVAYVPVSYEEVTFKHVNALTLDYCGGFSAPPTYQSVLSTCLFFFP
jgi:hypothetical protein